MLPAAALRPLIGGAGRTLRALAGSANAVMLSLFAESASAAAGLHCPQLVPAPSFQTPAVSPCLDHFVSSNNPFPSTFSCSHQFPSHPDSHQTCDSLSFDVAFLTLPYTFLTIDRQYHESPTLRTLTFVTSLSNSSITTSTPRHTSDHRICSIDIV